MSRWSWRKRKKRRKKNEDNLDEKLGIETSSTNTSLVNLSENEKTKTIGDSPEKFFIEGLEFDYKKAMTKAYSVAIIGIVVGLIFIAYNLYTSQEQKQAHNKPIQTKTSSYVEPERRDKVNANGDETVEQKNQEMDAFVNSEDVKNNNPDLVALKGRNYYMFDNKILLPLNNQEWVQYDNTSSTSGYGAISSYLPVDENQSNWRQKIIVHHIFSNKDFNCFEFTDKLVNGIIVNVQNQLEVDGSDFDIVKGLSFNYVRKDANDTLLYWGLNVPTNIPQVQFVRCFVSDFTKEPYLITYTIKTDGTLMDDQSIQNALRTLDSAQELK